MLRAFFAEEWTQDTDLRADIPPVRLPLTSSHATENLRLEYFGKETTFSSRPGSGEGRWKDLWCFGLAYRVGRTLLSAAFDPRLLSLTPAKQRSRQEVAVILERSEGIYALYPQRKPWRSGRMHSDQEIRLKSPATKGAPFFRVLCGKGTGERQSNGETSPTFTHIALNYSRYAGRVKHMATQPTCESLGAGSILK